MSTTETPRIRLDRPILISNLVSGALWLSPLALSGGSDSFDGWPLFLIGAGYVVVGSLFLAAVYGREVVTRRHEAWAWITPWLAAIALWSLILIGMEFENNVSHYLGTLFIGVVIATPCYLVWQIMALAIRQFLAWRSGRPSLPA